MKQRIELNALANMKMLFELETEECQDASTNETLIMMNQETFNSVKQQLELLERYMLAYNKAINNNTQTPYWHEVRDNPTLYPLNREIAD